MKKLNKVQRKKLGRILRKQRHLYRELAEDSREYSQKALADHFKVSQMAIHRIEVGEYEPSVRLWFEMARFFDLDPEIIEDL